MLDAQTTSYLDKQVANGLTFEQIKADMLAAGWNESQANAVITEYKNRQQAQTPANQAPSGAGQQQMVAADSVPLYRRYVPYALIVLFVPFGLLIGLGLLYTGDIFRKVKGSELYAPISDSEKRNITIAIVALLIIQVLVVINK